MRNASLHFEYQLNTNDLRRALYYGYLVRNRKVVRFALFALLVIFSYSVLSLTGAMPESALIFYIGLGYFVWLVLTAGSIEYQLLRQVKDKDSFLRKIFRVQVSESIIQIEVPSEASRLRVIPSQLYCAFEISRVFMLYISPEQVYLVPKSIMSEEEKVQLRSILLTSLGERFYSGALQKKK